MSKNVLLGGELELTVSRFRDPYRGHDTHDHPCDACTNLVKRHFYRNPRAVILTDITYLYYGSHAKLFYMCAFIDAFTAEILGIAASKNMNNSLVLKAYGDMTQNHEYHEFPAGAIVHSDQGSQFGAEKFRKIVKREGFLQSMSNRGNSLDNSPMESFFGTFKDENLFIDCQTFEEAETFVLEYKEFFNNIRTHSGICGLIPAMFYSGCVNGDPAVQHAVQHAIEFRLSQNKNVSEPDYQLKNGAEGQIYSDGKRIHGLRSCIHK